MCHNRFSENENEVVEAHIPRHRDSKTKKPRHWDSKTKKPRHWDSGTKKLRHRGMETIQSGHRDSKAFFQRIKSHNIEISRLKNHDIEIPRPKSHYIEFLWNCDPYTPSDPYVYAGQRILGRHFPERKRAFGHLVFLQLLNGCRSSRHSDVFKFTLMPQWTLIFY